MTHRVSGTVGAGLCSTWWWNGTGERSGALHKVPGGVLWCGCLYSNPFTSEHSELSVFRFSAISSYMNKAQLVLKKKNTWKLKWSSDPKIWTWIRKCSLDTRQMWFSSRWHFIVDSTETNILLTYIADLFLKIPFPKDGRMQENGPIIGEIVLCDMVIQCNSKYLLCVVDSKAAIHKKPVWQTSLLCPFIQIHYKAWVYLHI